MCVGRKKHHQRVETSSQIKNKQTAIWFTDKIEVEVKTGLDSDARKRGKMLNILQMFAAYGIPTIMIMFSAPYIIIGKTAYENLLDVLYGNFWI